MKSIQLSRAALILALAGSALAPAVARPVNHDMQRIALRAPDGGQHDRAPCPLESGRQAPAHLDQG